jgi:hypothetical protein
MKVKKMFLIAGLAALIISPTIHGKALAATVRTAVSVPVDPKFDVRGWVNPLDGAHYAMKLFEDGTTLAIRSSSKLNEARVNYEWVYDIDYQPSQSSGPRDILIAPPDQYQAVYDMWKARKLTCSVTRTVPDLFGNQFKLCQAAPFKVQVEGWTISSPGAGVVWIITPTVTSTQAPATGSGLPTWGR